MPRLEAASVPSPSDKLGDTKERRILRAVPSRDSPFGMEQHDGKGAPRVFGEYPTGSSHPPFPHADFTMSQFESPMSYTHFAHRVRRRSRFIRTADDRAFLEEVVRTAGRRIREVPAGLELWARPIGPRLEAGPRG